MFTSSDLIQLVRDSLHEYDQSPISDDKIMTKLNLAYTFAYNSLIKSNDSLFARWKYITIKPLISYYDLPKDMYNRRIERIWTPVPIYDPSKPMIWGEVERCDPSEIPNFQTQRFPTYYALRWTQMDDKVVIAPPPNAASVLRYYYTPAIIPMAAVEGQITEIVGNKITLDKTPSEAMMNNVSISGHNCISFSDEISGSVKALYPYNEINGYEVFLSANFNRATLRGKEVRKCYALNPATGIQYNPLTKECSCIFNSPVAGKVAIGDFIETSRIPSSGYNILDTVETDTDFYQPAEYTLPSNTFTKGCRVTAVTTSGITWYDPDVSPDFTNGYPTGFDDGTFTGTFTSMAVGTLYATPVVLFDCTEPHRLTVGNVYKLNISGTGTSVEGTKQCIPTGTMQIAILTPLFTGVFSGSATWTMYQYPSFAVTTGWPSIYDISPGHPRVEMLSIYIGSPFCYESRDTAGEDIPSYEDIIGTGITGTYDHKNDIKVGDWVTLGYSRAIPHSVEILAEFLVFYCTITMKSGLNETDPEMLAILKEKLSEIKSDDDGRNLMLKMQAAFQPGVAHYGRGRR